MCLRKLGTHAMPPAIAVDVSHFCAYKIKHKLLSSIFTELQKKKSSNDFNLALLELILIIKIVILCQGSRISKPCSLNFEPVL